MATLVKSPRKMEITIAIIDPTAGYIDTLASYLGMTCKELVLRVQSSLYKLHKAREGLTGAEKARFRLKVYNTIPIASVIILDAEGNNGRVQIDIKSYRVPRYHSFV